MRSVAARLRPEEITRSFPDGLLEQYIRERSSAGAGDRDELEEATVELGELALGLLAERRRHREILNDGVERR